MKYYIYGLSSNEDNVIRYIGQTKNSIKNRLNEHKCDALTRKLKSHKCNWIRKIYKNGFILQIDLIEETDEKHWQEREIYWIQEYRKRNNKLLNQLDGGQCGGIGGKFFQYTYNETKMFIKNSNLVFNTFKEYKKFVRKHTEYSDRLPLNPKKVFSYRGEWVSWGDYFSNDYVSDKEKSDAILPYENAKQLLFDNKITNISEYFEFIKNRNDLPQSPRSHYKGNGWVNHYDFFSKEKIVKCDYNTFCRYISFNYGELMTRNEYEKKFKEGKINKRLPFHPHRQYNKKWSEIKQDIANKVLTTSKKEK